MTQWKSAKACNKCKLVKPLTEFHRRTNAADGRQRMCKSCNTDWVRGRYAKNVEEHKKNIKKNRKDRNEFLKSIVANIKLIRGCKDCGYNEHSEALDFDHREHGKKIANVSILRSRGVALHSLLDEIMKCDVRCANCHRIKTARERDKLRAGPLGGGDTLLK